MIESLIVFLCYFVSISITYPSETMLGDQNQTKDSATVEENEHTLADKFITLENELVARLSPLISGRLKLKKNSHVEYVYNPLEYAADLHNKFVRKFCTSSKKILFLGINPGPWGMCQTGVPFGDVKTVKEYLKISGEVEEPKVVHPARRVEGLNCKRTEISGKRLWELIRNLSEDDPFVFFKDCFVYNYCPLAFLAGNATNITPADLKSDDQITLNSICDDYLLKTLKLLDIEIVVAIGRFVEKRVLEVLKKHEVKNIRLYEIPHPSPRSKGSNNWSENTIEILKEYGLIQYLKKH